MKDFFQTPKAEPEGDRREPKEEFEQWKFLENFDGLPRFFGIWRNFSEIHASVKKKSSNWSDLQNVNELWRISSGFDRIFLRILREGSRLNSENSSNWSRISNCKQTLSPYLVFSGIWLEFFLRIRRILSANFSNVKIRLTDAKLTGFVSSVSLSRNFSRNPALRVSWCREKLSPRCSATRLTILASLDGRRLQLQSVQIISLKIRQST